MELTAADKLLVVEDTLRGLEANRLRAEILAAGDEEQASRLDILDAQIEAARGKRDELRKAAAEEARVAHIEAIKAQPAAFEDLSLLSERTKKFYEEFTKDFLLDAARARGIEIAASAPKTDVIAAHVARDDEIRGV